MKKILITGISGFAGSHLAEYLLFHDSSSQIIGTYLSESSASKLGKISTSITLVRIDLQDQQQVRDLITAEKPDVLYHLAALASPAESFKHPKETLLTNVVMELHLLESLRLADLRETRVLIVGSGETYGAVKQNQLPINEETPFSPASPYAVSKITQEYLSMQYARSYGLSLFRVRPFNHIGPRQTPFFVVASFAKKIAEIEKGKEEPVLLVGNLETKRDFTDVRDIVRAYSLVTKKGTVGDVYNVGSGKSYQISEILDKLLGFARVPITVKTDDALLRPGDIPELVCDNTKIKEATGWEPKISLDQTLADTLDYWRNIV